MANEKLIAFNEVKKKLTDIRQYYSGYPDTEYDKFARAVVKLCIEEIDKIEPVDRWLKAEERPPGKYKKVLVKDRVTGEVTTAYWGDYNCFVFDDGRGHGADLWMPMPK